MSEIRLFGDLGRSTAIMRQLDAHCGARFPNVQKLLKDCPTGALIKLKERGALVSKDISTSLPVCEKGDDNYKTWSDYLQAIQDMCRRQYAEPHGELITNACDDLASHIGRRHYDQFPLWPRVGGHQQSFVDIRMDLYYNLHELVVVVISGPMNVKDQRPAQKEYIASCDGCPLFKVLHTCYESMAAVENLCKTHGYASVLDKCKQVASPTLSLEDF